MDELKKHLQQHRSELDMDEPDEAVWQHISQAVQPAKNKPVIRMIVQWVAAACILVLAGIGIKSLVQQNNGNSVANTPMVAKKTIMQPPVATPLPAHNDIHKEVLTAKLTPSKKTSPSVPVSSVNQNRQRQDLTMMNNVTNSFTQVINLQRARISSMPLYAESAAYFNDFKIQLKQLEKDEHSIKSDIARRGMTDELLSQLINIYQFKLNTLKQLQTEMTKLNNRYQHNRGPVDSVKTYFLNM